MNNQIAVIDLSYPSLFLYSIGEDWDNEEIENFIYSQGHKLSNCSWGVFDGEIQDLRNDIRN